jgi:lipopolysaccharide/colanic/teichoic acid biosynthesis glycosyltransferase
MSIQNSLYPPSRLAWAACDPGDGLATSPGYAAGKWAADFVLATVLLVLTAPLVLLSLVLMRLSSRGPGIYTQVRLGLHGRPFTIYKIRTMTQDCERTTGPCWSAAGDPRVTPVGRILRRTHVDELPQLWNVLRGQMSLVGPRPERPEIAVQLQRVIPHYGDRLAVLPGLTGLAQVQLPPDTDIADVRRKLACDLYYIQRINFRMDLRILLNTVGHVMGISYAVRRALLRMPSEDAIESAYRSLVGNAAGVPQMQPA